MAVKSWKLIPTKGAVIGEIWICPEKNKEIPVFIELCERYLIDALGSDIPISTDPKTQDPVYHIPGPIGRKEPFVADYNIHHCNIVEE